MFRPIRPNPLMPTLIAISTCKERVSNQIHVEGDPEPHSTFGGVLSQAIDTP